MQWISALASAIEVAGPYILGLAGIAGTVWGSAHQTRSAARSALLSDRRRAYSEFLAIVAEAETRLRVDFETIEYPEMVAYRDAASRAAGACKLLGSGDFDESVQEILDDLSRACMLIRNGDRARIPVSASDLRIGEMAFRFRAMRDAGVRSRRSWVIRKLPKSRKRKSKELEVGNAWADLTRSKQEHIDEISREHGE